MTATAVRIMQLEKERNKRLSEESQEDIDTFFEDLDKKGTTKVGYITNAFRQQGNVDYQLRKLKKRAKDAGLKTITVGKSNDQLIIYDASKQSAVDSTNKLLRTLKQTKALPSGVSKQKVEKLKKINQGLNNIKNKKAKVSKQLPKKGNSTKKAKNKNIKNITGNKEKRNISKKPKTSK